jgi:glycosyltransferase involved in cell wall biosynthesis
MSNKLVSVVVPVFNRAQYIRSTIDSILEQTYEYLEIILVNDGSTDDSLLILNEYKSKYPHKISVINQKNQGQVVARNNAISMSKGKYIAFLDSDDIWLPNKLELQLPLFRGNVALVYCGVEQINEKGECISRVYCDENIKGHIYLKLVEKNRITGGSVILDRKAIDKVGMFDTNFQVAENWDLWIRVSEYFEVDFVNLPLLKYRVHAGNMSGDSLKMIDVAEKMIIKHCPSINHNSDKMSACQNARANISYRRGLYYFSSYNYKEARKHFKDTLSLSANYGDTKGRLARTYLGRNVNFLLSVVKRKMLILFSKTNH